MYRPTGGGGTIHSLEFHRKLRVSRAAAHNQCGRFSEAADDCTHALDLDPNTTKFALYQRGIARFCLGEFSLSLEDFTKAADGGGEGPEARLSLPIPTWIRKCQAEMSGSTLPLRGASATSRQIAPAAVTGAASGAAETEDQMSAQSKAAASHARYDWTQSEGEVSVTVYCKMVNKEKAKIEFGEDHLGISLEESASGPFSLDLRLFESIVVAGCRTDYTPVKVEIRMPKKNKGTHWASLCRSSSDGSSAAGILSYPSSSTKKRDWERIDKEMQDTLKAEAPEGEEALNNLFKEIYARADENTRRAMVKSFQTSGGTVLSTNWGEVEGADYEKTKTAPEGQEWKKWDQ